MKKAGLLALRGTAVRLRPAVCRMLPDGALLPSIDDDWYVESLAPPKGVVRAHNQATGHFVDLSEDNVYEYRNRGVLVLKQQLTLFGRQVLNDPVPDPRARYVAPVLRSRSLELPAAAPPMPAECGIDGRVVLGAFLLGWALAASTRPQSRRRTRRR